MKKVLKDTFKGVLIVLGILILLIVVCIGGFVYLIDYRVTVVDTSQSVDQEYPVTLKAVGEPFLFSSASGRLVLQHKGKTVSKIDFDIADDGGSITPNKWEVSWNPDLVAVILSGSEQPDNLILMYYSGKIEQHSLSTRFGELFCKAVQESLLPSSMR